MSEYARRMAFLSSRIFGEVMKETNRKGNQRALKVLSTQPRWKNPLYVDYYPPYQKIDFAFENLRFHGLYR